MACTLSCQERVACSGYAHYGSKDATSIQSQKLISVATEIKKISFLYLSILKYSLTPCMSLNLKFPYHLKEQSNTSMKETKMLENVSSYWLILQVYSSELADSYQNIPFYGSRSVFISQNGSHMGSRGLKKYP